MATEIRESNELKFARGETGLRISDDDERPRQSQSHQAPASKFDLKANNGPSLRRPESLKVPVNGDLIICAGVRLKGEIVSCDVLTVEGEIEGRVQARQMIVTTSGSFSGRAYVERADVAGRLEGGLQVTGELVVRASGRVSGQTSYGRLEIEPGGEMRGHLSKLSPDKPNLLSDWGQRTGRWNRL